MKNESTQEVAYKVIKPICDELGYTLVEVSYHKEISGMVLAVTIDKPEGININDCERLSHALDDPLDIANISNDQPYNLNVSSYGLDRSLKTDYDFNKFQNKEIVIKFYAPFNNKKEIQAILLTHNNDSITIQYEGIEHNLKLKDVANIKPFIKF